MIIRKTTLLFFALILSSTLCFAQAPVAHFTADCKVLCLNGPPGPGNTTISFTYDGTGGTPTGYSWTFPDATPSTSTVKNPQNVSFASVAGGTTVLVTVTAANGSGSTSFTDTVFVVKKCQANYTISSNPICKGGCVVISDRSNFQPDTWVWTIQTDRSPNHDTTIFSQNPGTICFPDTAVSQGFTLEVKASRTNACFFQNDFNPGPVIIVSPCSPPQLTIAPQNNNICTGGCINFTSTVVSGTPPFTYAWIFTGANAPTSTLANPTNVCYSTNGGPFAVNCTVTDANGKTASANSSVTVSNCSGYSIINGAIQDTLCACSTSNLPYVASTFNAGNIFTAELSNAAGDFTSPTTIGSLSSTVGGNIAITIPCNTTAGNGYKIRIISSNPSTIGDSTAITISTIYTSAFTVIPISVCGTNTPVTITYTGDAPGSANFNWDFGGGTVINGSGEGPYSVGWSTTGMHAITLSVGSGSCSSPLTTNVVTVNAIPTSTFVASNDTVCTMTTFFYTGTASASATFAWTFADGTPGTAAGKGPQNATWTTAGLKTITLTVTDNNCVSSVTGKTVYVSLCTGVNTLNPSNDIIICPNPVENRLLVNSHSVLVSSIEITDVLGRTLLTQNENANQNTVDVNQLNAGVYFISVKCSNGLSVVRKFVKE